MPRYIGAADFKQQCLALIEKLPAEGIVVTKHGREVARVLPFVDENVHRIGSLAGKITIHDNLESTGAAWEADAQS